MRPDLVIFDCDGVLVDSEPISIAVLLDLIARRGHQVGAAEAYERFLGRSMASVCALLREDPGIEVRDADLDHLRHDLYARFRAELRPIAGIAEAVAALPGPVCVASSSQPERIRLSLEVTGLISLFEPHIFSASMVANGKPAPDLFLHAARAMGADPARCVVIEDSLAGILAARSAGMQVFAFTGGAHAEAAGLAQAAARLEPDAVFDRMAELPDLLETPRGATAP
ncbi:HAD family hydrolase [Methylobrevis pamukkalensis]|uniref:6-phosphogluconate phosphatase n=1 Tax=Methylobrevis pamukkalensis TaxID=1439726 RepID=A0A1E3H6K4_9HYPH|nr:HAD family hydrolase [Methylobrevis pamukkalensis]ODN71968.1 6-phosphogluconate phosphatase [Methylobrevis pamukkalensis]